MSASEPPGVNLSCWLAYPSLAKWILCNSWPIHLSQNGFYAVPGLSISRKMDFMQFLAYPSLAKWILCSSWPIHLSQNGHNAGARFS
eukprot:COSAG01_NODE_19_length_39011_cov_38.134968_13_plen_87_part_00